MQMLTTRAVGRDPWEETPDRCLRIPQERLENVAGDILNIWNILFRICVLPKSGWIDASPRLSHLTLWTSYYWCCNTVDNSVKFVSTKCCQCHGDPGVRRQAEKAVSPCQTHGLCCLVFGYSCFLSMNHLKWFVLLGDLVGAASFAASYNITRLHHSHAGTNWLTAPPFLLFIGCPRPEGQCEPHRIWYEVIFCNIILGGCLQ